MSYMTEQSPRRFTALLPGYIILVILGVIELTTPYDVFNRRIALCATDLAAIVLLFLLQRALVRHGYRLPLLVQWSAIAGVGFDAAGNFLRLYGSIVWWDKLAHAVGSAAVALALYALVREFRSVVPFAVSRWWTSLFVLGTTSVLAMLYEISEYLGDLAFQTHRVTDLYDTADDLLWNLVGTFLVVCVLFLSKRRMKQAAL